MNRQYIEQKSFYMHPRYQEFLAFLEGVQTEARINPNALNLAFDVWLSNQLNVELINENTILRAKADAFLKSCKAYEESNETLKADLDRLHRERDSFQRQASVLAEEVERLQSDLKRARDALASVLIGLGGQEFGERGEVCLSIDGGNL